MSLAPGLASRIPYFYQSAGGLRPLSPGLAADLSDTQPGSSGSPVLDDSGHLVALHHAGGRPQEVAGKPPIRKNEGIRIPRVLSGLATLQTQVP